jgi:transposase
VLASNEDRLDIPTPNRRFFPCPPGLIVAKDEDMEDCEQAVVASRSKRRYRSEEEKREIIDHLKLLLARLRRIQFGRKSEKLARQIEQLELKLEHLENQSVASTSPSQNPSRSETPNASGKPGRRPLPEHLPRQIRLCEPEQQACPGCGGELRKLGEDVSEVLERVPASFYVIRHVRPKLSCTACA